MKTLLIICFLANAGLTLAQGIFPLKVGETMPDVMLGKTVNLESKNVKLSEFNAKVIVLDFWATYCSPCITSIVRHNKTAVKYPETLLIVPISSQQGELVKPFLDRLERVMKVKIFSIVEDKTFKSLFPTSTVPHYVVLDRNLKVIQITSELELDEHFLNTFFIK
jgi:thiol-disulfide isomerase/thioredoxin